MTRRKKQTTPPPRTSFSLAEEKAGTGLVWAPCAVCGRQGRGFLYRSPIPDRRVLHFCSMRCQTLGSALAAKGHGMIDKTPFETKAIKDARRPFAEALVDLGLMAPFKDRTPEEIDQIIEACVTGFQESMQRQALNDDIPF